MKKLLVAVMMVAVLNVAGLAQAATGFDGAYNFQSRSIEGNPSMQGWWGMMVITNNTLSRVYHSPDGTTEKFYVGDLKKEGEFFTVTFTDTYKKKYVGDVHRNKFTFDAGMLTILSDDGKFKEIWKRAAVK